MPERDGVEQEYPHTEEQDAMMAPLRAEIATLRAALQAREQEVADLTLKLSVAYEDMNGIIPDCGHENRFLDRHRDEFEECQKCRAQAREQEIDEHELLLANIHELVWPTPRGYSTRMDRKRVLAAVERIAAREQEIGRAYKMLRRIADRKDSMEWWADIDRLLNALAQPEGETR